MTTFLLVRHAAHDNVGAYLAGRSPGVRLGPAGLVQAKRLADRLRAERIDRLLASPRERTRETAEAILQGRDIAWESSDALDEIDFGEWSGRTFAQLNADPRWTAWNAARLCAVTPAGEGMAAVQARVTGLMLALAAKMQDATVALVSHADVIKAAIFHALGMALDSWARIDIAPASVSRLRFTADGPVVLSLNEQTP